MRDFDEGVNAMVRILGMLFQNVQYGEIESACRKQFKWAYDRLIDEFSERENEDAEEKQ